MPAHTRPRPQTDPRRLLAAHEAAVAFYRGQLAAAEGPRQYLTQRGLGAVVDREWPWRVGYAPAGWDHLARHLRDEWGFTADELTDAGLAKPTLDDANRIVDVFRDRLMFPVTDPAGHTVAFVGRASPVALAEDSTPPKYLNTRESSIYKKGAVLYGMGQQQDRIGKGFTPALVEGPTDVLAVWLSYSKDRSTGVVAVADCGTALTPIQADILRQMPGAAEALIVAFDADLAGGAAAAKAFHLLHRPPAPLPHGDPGRGRPALLAAELPAGTDPADLLREAGGRARIRHALKRTRPLVEAVMDYRLAQALQRTPRLLDDVGGRVDAVRLLTPLLFQADDPASAARLLTHLVRLIPDTHFDTVLRAAASHVEAVCQDLSADLRLSGSRPPQPAAARAFLPLTSAARGQVPPPQPDVAPPPAPNRLGRRVS